MVRPIKIRILEIMEDGKERWSNELVEEICKEYGISIKNNVSRDYINFDLIEMAASGFLQDVDQKIDTQGILKKDSLIHKYVITSIGKEKASILKN